MSPGDERPVFLVGFMGAGKTAVGQALARRLGWSFVDTDAEVEKREGRSIGEIFAAAGESGFRELERQVLEALDGRCRCVVAAGGGLYAQARSRRWMRERGRTVWLDCQADEIRRRVDRGAVAARPLWNAADPVEWRARYERRKASYALAELRVDCTAGGPDEIAGRVLDALRGPRAAPAGPAPEGP